MANVGVMMTVRRTATAVITMGSSVWGKELASANVGKRPMVVGVMLVVSRQKIAVPITLFALSKKRVLDHV